MPTITGRVWNKNGTRTISGASVFLVRESDGARVQQTSSSEGGAFIFTVSDTVTEYSILAEAAGVRMGVTSGVTGV